MKITVIQTGNASAMDAVNEDGLRLAMDSSAEAGGTGYGMRPMQLLLCAIGGCSVIDIGLILKKQKCECLVSVDVEGDREPEGHCSLFRKIRLHYTFRGSVTTSQADRAIRLSLTTYCSVAKTLEPTAQISYSFTIIQ